MQGLAAREALYSGCRADAKAYVEAWINARYDSTRTRQMLFKAFGWAPLTRMVVDTLATAYMAPPVRRLVDYNAQELGDDDAAQAALRVYAEALNLDGLGASFEAKTILLNSAWMWVQWDPYVALPRYEIVSPARIVALPHEAWPTDVQQSHWIAVERRAAQVTAATGWTTPPRRFDMYRREADGTVSHQCVDVYGKRVPGTPEYPPLRDYPLVRVAELEDGDLYPEGADDLLEEPLNYGVGVAESRIAMRYSAFPQWTLSRATQAQVQNIVVGPGVLLPLDEAQELKIVEPGNSVQAADALRNEHVQRWLRTRSLPSDLWGGDGKVESGLSRFVQRIPLIEQRTKRLHKWRQYEAALWDATTAVRKAHVLWQGGDYAFEWAGTPRVNPPDLTETRMVASFPDVQATLTPAEQYELLRKRWEDGLESPADTVAKERSIDRDAAALIVAENKRASAPVAATEAPNPNVSALLAEANRGEGV